MSENQTPDPQAATVDAVVPMMELLTSVDVIRSWCSNTAAIIADDLLTTGHGEIGTRLQVMQEQSDGSERDLGGWCRSAIEKQIDARLRKLFEVAR